MNMTFTHGLGMIAFWIFVLTIIMYLFSKDKENQISPLDIIKKRFAKGEITQEEFNTLKESL